ncbi:Tim10/DDP family zinc finger [Ancylostoma duodenale]|uniref:Mitochondrial import inner membrane translocase subunit n=1 Tax=Ancylostoma duodenale TaxID=51022 RepID=A0A0C2GRW0_9BILA|nr:Tim10/DDP family zinc finger [Ancylostoma duodenale]
MPHASQSSSLSIIPDEAQRNLSMFYLFNFHILQDLSEKCTHKCISSPGSSLSNSDKQCLQRCMDRFMDSWNLVSQTLQKRLQEELTSAGAFNHGSSFS